MSNLGAGALLISILWISTALSVDRLNPETEKIISVIELTPVLAGNNVYFNIKSNIENVSEYFYCISPDEKYRSTGFVSSIKENKNVSLPSTLIKNTQREGTAEIFVKFTDGGGNESSAWHFSVDVALERFNLYKKFVLNSDYPWIYADYYKFDNTTKLRINNDLFSPIARECVADVIYSVNNDSLDTKLNLAHYHMLYLENRVFDPYKISSTEGRDENMKKIFSRVIFKDGTSSDIRLCEF